MYMGIGARDVIVAGDSAGGNLALELALAVKAQGRSQPRALVLMSPWTDMTMQGASYQKCAALDPMLTHDYIDSCRTAYRGANSTLEWEDPSLSPLFADLRGLPPTLIQVGTNEILKSDSINLAKAMTEQEVYAVLEVYPMPHRPWKALAALCRKFCNGGTPPDRRAAICPKPGIKSIMSPKYFWRPSTGGTRGCSASAAP